MWNMIECEAMVAAVVLASTLACPVMVQGEASAESQLSNISSGLTALVSSLTNSASTLDLVPQMEQSMQTGLQLMQVLDGAISDTDRLASEFKQKAKNAVSEPGKQFYLQKATVLTRQSDQLFKERAKVEQAVEVLKRIIAKSRSGPAAQTKGKTD